jgi:hypothetical protein
MLQVLKNRKENKYLLGGLCILLLWAVFTLLNLTRIPIAWVDEVMDLDPAFRWVNGLGYNSYLWYYEGTEKVFAANLPLRNLPFALSVYWAGADIFWIRLPSFLFALGFALFAFLLFRQFLTNDAWAVLCLLFLLFDKGFYESLRAVRSEMLQVFLLAWALFLAYKNAFRWGYFLLCGLLFWIHPSLWSMAAVLSLYGLLQLKSNIQRYWGIGWLLLPSIIVFSLMDYSAFYSQLFDAGKDHSSFDFSLWELIKGHFYTRFSAYFPSQIWQWLVLLFAHFIALRSLVKNKGKDLVAWLFLSTSLYWFAVLAPHYRYNPPFLFLGFLLLIQWMNSQAFFRSNKSLIGGYSLLSVHVLPVCAILFLGLTQRQARDPYAVQQWMQTRLPHKEKFLLTGEVIGAYALMNKFGNTKGTYCVPIYPQKFPLDSFTSYYVFTSENLFSPTGHAIEPLQTYKVPENPYPWIRYVHAKSGSLHYGNMHLYALSKEQMKTYLKL